MPSRKRKTPLKRGKPGPSSVMDFTTLVAAIQQAHEHCATQASRAVNVSLTLRNWIIGGYIHHYELHGHDRANYGDGLFTMLADRLQSLNIPNCGKSRLYRYRDFFRLYPQIVATLSPQFQDLLTAEVIETSPFKVNALSY